MSRSRGCSRRSCSRSWAAGDRVAVASRGTRVHVSCVHDEAGWTACVVGVVVDDRAACTHERSRVGQHRTRGSRRRVVVDVARAGFVAEQREHEQDRAGEPASDQSEFSVAPIAALSTLTASSPPLPAAGCFFGTGGGALVVSSAGAQPCRRRCPSCPASAAAFTACRRRVGLLRLARGLSRRSCPSTSSPPSGQRRSCSRRRPCSTQLPSYRPCPSSLARAVSGSSSSSLSCRDGRIGSLRSCVLGRAVFQAHAGFFSVVASSCRPSSFAALSVSSRRRRPCPSPSSLSFEDAFRDRRKRRSTRRQRWSAFGGKASRQARTPVSRCPQLRASACCAAAANASAAF